MLRWPPLALALALVASSDALGVEIVTEPFLGVRRIEIIETVPRPLYINVIEIDLAEPTLSFRVTPRAPGAPPISGGIPAETQFQSTRNFLAQQNGQLAINGSFFGGTYPYPWTNSVGLAASDGDVYSFWENSQEPIFRHGLNIAQDNVARVVARHGLQEQGYETSPRLTPYNSLAGSHRLIQAGTINPNNDFHLGTFNPLGSEPRTAAGLTNNLDSTAKKLLLVTVDGRQNGFSEGMSLLELANFMAGRGVTDAVSLDGGGSTSMMVNYHGDTDPAGSAYGVRAINSTINGNVPGGERSVGTNLAMFAAANPAYTPPAQPALVPAGYTLLESFEADEGRFGGAPTASGSTFGVSNASLFDRVENESYYGLGSQRLTVRTSNPAQPGLGLRHLSGGGDPAGNAPFASTGYVGFFMKVLQTGVATGVIEASLIIDDGAAHEQSLGIDVIADGDWHLYQWNLDDVDQWSDFAGGNGQIDAASVTLDSIYLSSDENVNFNVFFDLLVHNPGGDLSALQVPDVEPGQDGDFNGDEYVDGADFLAWQRGDSPDPLSEVDLQDWKDNFGATPSSIAEAAVPEPSAAALMSLAVSAVTARYRPRSRSAWRLGRRTYHRLGASAGVLIPLTVFY